MSVLVTLRRALAEPRLRGIDMDGDERIAVHREILAQKPMIRDVFREIYEVCRKLDREHFRGEGLRVEIGAGSSLFKSYHPDVLSSDVQAAVHLDMALDAHHMDLTPESVRALYGIHCFHHLRDPALFFAELRRVLCPGGGCILVEPYHGPLASVFYKRVFDTEHFDKSQKRWDLGDELTGVMTGANQALSWIVFQRDRKRFETENPGLEVVAQRRLHNYLRYLISGGINFRQLLPTALAPVLGALETLLSPIDHLFALHHVIVLRKRLE